jgi:hypothetical protein
MPGISRSLAFASFASDAGGQASRPGVGYPDRAAFIEVRLSVLAHPAA